MKITLQGIPFKKKTYEVKQSVKNMRKTYKLQLVFSKTQDMEGKSDEEAVDTLLEAFDTAIDYISSLLKLSDKQKEELEDLEQTQLIELANQIAMKLMGMSEADLKENDKKK